MKGLIIGVLCSYAVLIFLWASDFTPDSQIRSGQVIKIYNEYYKCSEQEFSKTAP